MLSILPLIVAMAAPALVPPAAPAAPAAPALTRLDGTPLPGDTTAGKVVLFVNVASRCGFTPQYAGLEKLYQTYKDRGFVILGAPCNQFGGQEPGTPVEIQQFCSTKYSVTFPLLEKQDVNGAARSPLYTTLVSSKAGGGKDIGWNFEKFLVGRDGQVIARWASATKPDDAAVTAAVEAALGAKH